MVRPVRGLAAAPLDPHWARPSHPDIQEVITGRDGSFASKSFSRIGLPPFAVFAKLAFPPCTPASEATYATVQTGKGAHLNLNSDLLYINHSCEPTLIFDTTNLNILVGSGGIRPGDELTFFYPSTEWEMARPFDCLCGKPTCRGRISGAKHMTAAQLEGVWLNGHIRKLLDERARGAPAEGLENGYSEPEPAVAVAGDPTAQALKEALVHAEKVVAAARAALRSYVESTTGAGLPTAGAPPGGGRALGVFRPDDVFNRPIEAGAGFARRGPTSRELSGEMGGDTVV